MGGRVNSCVSASSKKRRGRMAATPTSDTTAALGPFYSRSRSSSRSSSRTVDPLSAPPRRPEQISPFPSSTHAGPNNFLAGRIPAHSIQASTSNSRHRYHSQKALQIRPLHSPLSPALSHRSYRRFPQPNPNPKASTGSRHPAVDIQTAATVSSTSLHVLTEPIAMPPPAPCSSRSDACSILEVDPNFLTSCCHSSSGSRHPTLDSQLVASASSALLLDQAGGPGVLDPHPPPDVDGPGRRPSSPHTYT